MLSMIDHLSSQRKRVFTPLVGACYSPPTMEAKLSETFGDRLRRARERKSYSQGAVATYCGLRTYLAVSKWETGYNFPELSTLQAVAHFLDVSIDYLVTGDELANTINARVRKIPPVLRDGLIMRLNKEIEAAEQAALLLPPEMRATHIKDADERVRRFADANLRKAIPAPKKKPKGAK